MTIRFYKKNYYICRDDNGQMIYAGDTVEVHDPMETRTSYQSVVHWNRIDGAFVDAHPAHVKMNLSTHRDLRDYLGKKDRSLYDQNENLITQSTSCIKIKSFYKQ